MEVSTSKLREFESLLVGNKWQSLEVDGRHNQLALVRDSREVEELGVVGSRWESLVIDSSR